MHPAALSVMQLETAAGAAELQTICTRLLQMNVQLYLTKNLCYCFNRVPYSPSRSGTCCKSEANLVYLTLPSPRYPGDCYFAQYQT